MSEGKEEEMRGSVWWRSKRNEGRGSREFEGSGSRGDEEKCRERK